MLTLFVYVKQCFNENPNSVKLYELSKDKNRNLIIFDS